MFTLFSLLLCTFISSFYLSQLPVCQGLLAGERIPIAFDTLLKGAFSRDREQNDLEVTELWKKFQSWLHGKDLYYPYARISYTLEGRCGFPQHDPHRSRQCCTIGEDEEMIVPTGKSSSPGASSTTKQHGERLIIFTLPKGDPGIACVSLEIVDRFQFCPIRRCAVRGNPKDYCKCSSEGIKSHTIQEEITHRYIVYRGPVSLALLFGKNNTSYRNSPMLVDTIDPKDTEAPLMTLAMLEDQIEILKGHEFFMLPRAVSGLYKQWNCDTHFEEALNEWKYPKNSYYSYPRGHKDWSTYQRIIEGLDHYYSRKVKPENLIYQVNVEFPYGKNVAHTSSFPLKCAVKYKNNNWAKDLQKDTLYYFTLISRPTSPAPPDKNPAIVLGLSLPFVLAGSTKFPGSKKDQVYRPCDGQQFLNKFYDCRMTYLEFFQYPIIPISPTLIPVNSFLHDAIYVSFALPAQDFDDSSINRDKHLAGIIYKKKTSSDHCIMMKRISIFSFSRSSSEQPFYFAAAVIRLDQGMISEDYNEFQFEFVYISEFTASLVLKCEEYEEDKVFYKALLDESVKGEKLENSTLDYSLVLKVENPRGISEFLNVDSDEFKDYGPKINALYQFYKQGRDMEKKYSLTKVCFPASKFDVSLTNSYVLIGNQIGVRLTFLKNTIKLSPIPKINIYLNSYATLFKDDTGEYVPFVKRQLVKLQPPDKPDRCDYDYYNGYEYKNKNKSKDKDENKLYILLNIHLNQPSRLAYHIEHELEFEVETEDQVVTRGFSGLFKMVIQGLVSERVFTFPVTDEEVLPFRITALFIKEEKFSNLQKDLAVASYAENSLAYLLNVDELFPRSASVFSTDPKPLPPIFASNTSPQRRRYIIQLKSSPTTTFTEHMADIRPIFEADTGSTILLEFKDFYSYSAKLSDNMKAILKERNDILYIEAVSSTSICSLNINQRRKAKLFASPIVFQPNSPWALARISSEGRYQPNDIFRFPASSGTGVDVFVLDTGIFVNHEGFGGRAVLGANFVPNEPSSDVQGHGTFIAGLIGSSVFGVAKAVNLISVKILNGRGSGNADVLIAGIYWAVAQASINKRPSIINMSLFAKRSQAINDAVERALAAGVLVVTAAGNESKNACIYSPASSSAAITVSSSDAFDFFSPFSNWGTCVDILAPGTSVSSSFIGSPSAFATDSGTSQAAALVSGTAALILSENPEFSPLQVRAVLMAIAAKNALTALPIGTPNMLLDTSLLL